MMVVAACGAPGGPGSERADLPATTPAEFEGHLAGIDRPIIVNIWGSWCLPCRAEAPLLDTAFKEYGDRIEFIGIAVRDTQHGAKQYLNEFGLDFDHFFDKTRTVVNHYGGIGTPVTFFFGPGGVLVTTHNGIIDDRALAVNIDELLNLDS